MRHKNHLLQKKNKKILLNIKIALTHISKRKWYFLSTNNFDFKFMHFSWTCAILRSAHISSFFRSYFFLLCYCYKFTFSILFSLPHCRLVLFLILKSLLPASFLLYLFRFETEKVFKSFSCSSQNMKNNISFFPIDIGFPIDAREMRFIHLFFFNCSRQTEKPKRNFDFQLYTNFPHTLLAFSIASEKKIVFLYSCSSRAHVSQ